MKRTQIGSADLDAETLQTDVMRFMAILGFCLMAILALVRNVDSLPGPAPTREAVRPVELPHPVDRRSQPAPEVKAPAPARSEEKRSLEPPQPKRSTPVQPPPLVKREPPPAMPPAPPPSPSVAVKPAPAAAAKQESLVLRFASDADFLKLVSNAAIEVYAYDTATAFKLSPGLAFVSAARPPRVHELLEETIPALVREALSRAARAERGSLLWGVRLPADIESSIERHLAQQRTGVLLIDRNGSVRHVASS
jgi:hypothetical protein